eukprot:g7010.t1
MQSLNETYHATPGFPLTTLSDWGWHSSPPPIDQPDPFKSFKYTYLNTSEGRAVPYPLDSSGADGEWLRANPHRLNLLQVSLRRRNDTRKPLGIGPGDVDAESTAQALDLWTGVLDSNFSVGGAAVRTRTACHPELDVLSWRVEGAALLGGAQPLALRLAFPYGSQAMYGDGADWAHDAAHTTTINVTQNSSAGAGAALFTRALDWDGYSVLCRWSGSATGGASGDVPVPVRLELTRDGPHAVVLSAPPGEGSATATAAAVELSCLLAPPGVRYPVGAGAPWLAEKAAATRALLAGGGAGARSGAGSGSAGAAAGAGADAGAGAPPTKPAEPAEPAELPLFSGPGGVAAASAAGFGSFWGSGAFVDLAGAGAGAAAGAAAGAGAGAAAGAAAGFGTEGTGPDPRALELERRVVLSQFLTRIHSAGSTPPQETGFALNSWYGKFHHEMRWFHQAHFVLWQRPHFAQRADGWYLDALPNASAYAAFQGYAGARWPKMVGPATAARESSRGAAGFDAPSVGTTTYSNATHPLLYWTGPSSTGPMLVWQQPHLIWLGELQRLHAPDAAAAARVEARLGAAVEATADFMASYPAPPLPGRANSTRAGELWLGPPTDGAEEGNPPADTWNPTFELTYWRWGLQTAAAWRARAGAPPKQAWARALAALAEPTVLPAPVGGKHGPAAYAINANCYGFPDPDPPAAAKQGKHRCSGAYGSHPMVLGALGMIDGRAVSPPLDAQLMNATLAYSIEGWDWAGTWGWDYPMWAFSMMRLGWRSGAVVDMLLRAEEKNAYLANGHNFQSSGLACYLPGNGGLLAAVAMMAGGYTGAGGRHQAVGFPEAWGAVSEGFKAYP